MTLHAEAVGAPQGNPEALGQERRKGLAVLIGAGTLSLAVGGLEYTTAQANDVLGVTVDALHNFSDGASYLLQALALRAAEARDRVQSRVARKMAAVAMAASGIAGMGHTVEHTWKFGQNVTNGSVDLMKLGMEKGSLTPLAVGLLGNLAVSALVIKGMGEKDTGESGDINSESRSHAWLDLKESGFRLVTSAIPHELRAVPEALVGIKYGVAGARLGVRMWRSASDQSVPHCHDHHNHAHHHHDEPAETAPKGLFGRVKERFRDKAAEWTARATIGAQDVSSRVREWLTDESPEAKPRLRKGRAAALAAGTFAVGAAGVYLAHKVGTSPLDSDIVTAAGGSEAAPLPAPSPEATYPSDAPSPLRNLEGLSIATESGAADQLPAAATEQYATVELPVYNAKTGDGTVWNAVTDYASQLGYEPDNAQISQLTERTLQHNNLTYEQATRLPVGFEVKMLTLEEIEELLDIAK